MEVLSPLIRALKIDTQGIFNSEMPRETPALRQLRLLIEDCSEDDAASIISLFTLYCPYSINAMQHKSNKSCPPFDGNGIKLIK